MQNNSPKSQSVTGEGSGIGTSSSQRAVSNPFIWGTPGDDTIFGDDRSNFIFGRAGDDVIHGGGGTDFLFGGRGNDDLFGDDGNDFLFGGRGNDHLNGGNGNDFLLGGRGNDWLEGGEGNDFLLGGRGNDILSGGNGDDFLRGGSGNDSLNGDNGNDRLYGGSGDDFLAGGKGSDIINGGSGIDTVSYLGEKNVSGHFRWGLDIDLEVGTVTVRTDLQSGSRHTDTDTLYSIENVVGTNVQSSLGGNHVGSGGDTIRGTGHANTFWGMHGNDLLDGRGGNDTLFGGTGKDLLLGGAGNDTLDGGTGDDTLNGGTGNDLLTTGDGFDTIRFDDSSGYDQASDFANGFDTIDMSGLGLTAANAHTQVDIVGVGADTYITFGNSTLQLVGVSSNQISFDDDFIFA